LPFPRTGRHLIPARKGQISKKGLVRKKKTEGKDAESGTRKKTARPRPCGKEDELRSYAGRGGCRDSFIQDKGGEVPVETSTALWEHREGHSGAQKKEGWETLKKGGHLGGESIYWGPGKLHEGERRGECCLKKGKGKDTLHNSGKGKSN